jgi:hypothetical protein
MLRGLRLFTPSAGLLAFSLLVPACKQGSGARCEIDSDCSDGLTCQPGPPHNGICGNPGTTILMLDAATQVDTAPPVDAAAVDAEAAPVDAAAPDTAAVDAATPDTSAVDTAAPDTAAPDVAPDTAKPDTADATNG